MGVARNRRSLNREEWGGFHFLIHNDCINIFKLVLWASSGSALGRPLKHVGQHFLKSVFHGSFYHKYCTSSFSSSLVIAFLDVSSEETVYHHILVMHSLLPEKVGLNSSHLDLLPSGLTRMVRQKIPPGADNRQSNLRLM
jgi:hypothetical protein